MLRLKVILIDAGALFVLVALAVVYYSLQSLAGIPAAQNYEDKGIYTFIPYQVLPLQVQNNSAYNRERRIHPEKTLYMVYYQATDGSGYKHTEMANTQEEGAEIIAKGENVTRRVLMILVDNTYITIEPNENAKSHTAKLQKKYRISLILSGTYILLYALLWCVLIIKKRRTKTMPNN